MDTKLNLKIATTTLAARGYLNLPVPSRDTIVSEIKRLKKEKNAVTNNSKCNSWFFKITKLAQQVAEQILMVSSYNAYLTSK